MSVVLRSMVEVSGTDEDIPLPNISGDTLKRVIDYCSMYRGRTPPPIEMPLRAASFAEMVSPEDFKFLDIELEVLFELILAANFLNIKPLLDLACSKVSFMIKGKTVEQIRSQFGIVNDFTPEQEAQVREENKWCEDA